MPCPAAGGRRAVALLALGLTALALLAAPSPAPADIAIGGPPPEAFSGAARLNATSADGRRVVFSSRRSLARADRDRTIDVYLRAGGRTGLLSRGLTGRGANREVRFVAATPDARTILFRTAARLSADDTDSGEDLYRHGPDGLELVSTGQPGAGAADEGLRFSLLSENGRRVFLLSEKRLLGEDADDRRDVYEYRGGRLRLVSTATAGPVKLLAIAADGSRAVVSTDATLDPADVDGRADIYAYGPEGTTLVSAGGLDSCPPFGPQPCEVRFAAASADARIVYFETEDRLSPLDLDSRTDVYRGGAGGTQMVSTGPGDSQISAARLGAISADGRRALFVGGNFRGLAADTYCGTYERRGEVTRLVSVVRGRPVAAGGCERSEAAFSADGSAVFFSGGGGSDRSHDLYRLRRGRATLVSAPARSRDRLGAFLEHVSGDGSRIAFLTWRPLVRGDTDGGYDIYSRGPRGFTLVSIGLAGGNGAHSGPPGSLIGDVFPQYEGASDDGRRLFFTTEEALLRRDRNGRTDLYERGPAGLRLVSTR